MLKPEQVREIRRTLMIHPDDLSAKGRERLADGAETLLADRAEIAQELERMQRNLAVSSCGYCHATDKALTALIERIKA